MKLDHVCLGVKSIEPVAEKLCNVLGYHIKTNKVENTRQKVIVQFLGKDGSLDIKLIEPSTDDSPLWPFVKKGGGLHHICFKTDDVNEECRNLEDKGVRIITRPQPGEAFDDELIAFCFAGFGLNFEVIDTDKRRNRI